MPHGIDLPRQMFIQQTANGNSNRGHLDARHNPKRIGNPTVKPFLPDVFAQASRKFGPFESIGALAGETLPMA
ncbi:MAG: hypothetical protein R3C05_11740 [Pirellulaceae bacterium]